MKWPLALMLFAACRNGATTGDDGAKIVKVHGEHLDVRDALPIDDSRTAAIVGQNQQLSVLDTAGNGWARPISCPMKLAWSASKDLVLLLCQSGAEKLWVTAYRVADGQRAWESAPLDGEMPSAGSNVALTRDGNLVFARWEHGIAAIDTTSGRARWRLDHSALQVIPLGNELVLEYPLKMEIVSRDTGAVVDTHPGLVLGAWQGGVCIDRTDPHTHGGGGAIVVRDGGARERELVPASQLNALKDKYGVMIVGCGKRGDATVLLFDADAHNYLVTVRGADTHAVELPPTYGAPSTVGWDRDLPRMWPMVTKSDSVVVVDLDAAKTAYEFELAKLPVHDARLSARDVGRWLFKYDTGYVVVDGDAAGVAATPRGTLLSSGDQLWLSDNGTRTPLTTSKDAPAAHAWANVRVAR